MKNKIIIAILYRMKNDRNKTIFVKYKNRTINVIFSSAYAYRYSFFNKDYSIIRRIVDIDFIYKLLSNESCEIVKSNSENMRFLYLDDTVISELKKLIL